MDANDVVIGGVRMPFGAAKCVEETGVNVENDLIALRNGVHTVESLLAHCLDGVEDNDHERIDDWHEYVQSVVIVARI